MPHIERAEARTKVLCDTKLSHGAARLYCILDQKYTVADKCSPKHGTAWPKLQRLAEDLNASERQVRRYLDELESPGYIATTRRRYSGVYKLFWATPEWTPMSTLENSRVDIHVRSEWTPMSALYNHRKEPVPSTVEVERASDQSSTRETSARLLAPPPVNEEPATPEDRLLVGLDNRELVVNPRMAAKLVQILEEAPVDFFFEVLDRELLQKFRKRQEFQLCWLPQVTRDALCAWRRKQVATARPALRAAAAIA